MAGPFLEDIKTVVRCTGLVSCIYWYDNVKVSAWFSALKINIEFVKEFKYLGNMTNSTQLDDAEAKK